MCTEPLLLAQTDKTRMPDGLIHQASAPAESQRRGFSDEIFVRGEVEGSHAVVRVPDFRLPGMVHIQDTEGQLCQPSEVLAFRLPRERRGRADAQDGQSVLSAGAEEGDDHACADRGEIAHAAGEGCLHQPGDLIFLDQEIQTERTGRTKML